jgi:hypothetical protein
MISLIENYTVDIKFPYFKINVNASDPKMALHEACKILKTITDMKSLDFGGYLDYFIEER